MPNKIFRNLFCMTKKPKVKQRYSIGITSNGEVVCVMDKIVTDFSLFPDSVSIINIYGKGKTKVITKEVT